MKKLWIFYPPPKIQVFCYFFENLIKKLAKLTLKQFLFALLKCILKKGDEILSTLNKELIAPFGVLLDVINCTFWGTFIVH